MIRKDIVSLLRLHLQDLHEYLLRTVEIQVQSAAADLTRLHDIFHRHILKPFLHEYCSCGIQNILFLLR